MKTKNYFLIILFLFPFICLAQNSKLKSIDLQIGKSLSKFTFIGSDGNPDNSYNYIVGDVYNLNLCKEYKRNTFRSSFGFRQAGSYAIIQNIPLKWELNYLDLAFGYLFDFIKTENFKLSPGLAVYGSYLLNGVQHIDINSYSIKNLKKIEDHEFGCQAITNIKIKTSSNIFLTLEYRIQIGLTKLDLDKTQNSKSLSHLIQFGIASYIY